MTGTLGWLAGGGVLVVVLDDLQWADAESLELAEFAVRHLQAAPVLLLGTYREHEVGGRLDGLAGSSELVSLGGLDAAATRTLMAGIVGAAPSEEEAAEAWRRTGGNPFFVGELSRLAVAAGGLGSLTATALPRLPRGVRETLERRLARVSQPCADLLAIAAVAGPILRPDLLARLTGETERLGDLLAEAVSAGVVHAPAEALDPPRFAHDLFREAILAGLPPAARAALHARVAAGLEELHAAGADVHAAEVAAQHGAALAAGDQAAAGPAVHWSLAAAEEARTRLAFDDACGHVERALAAHDRAPQPDAAQRLELLVALAQSRALAGAADARATALGAAALARRLHDAEALGRAALVVHELGTRSAGSITQSRALLAEAAAALRHAGDAARDDRATALRARVLAGLAREEHYDVDGDPGRSRAHADEAVAVARVTGDPGTVAFCLLALHDAGWGPGTARSRLPVIADMEAHAQAAGDRALAAQARQLRAAALLELGEPEGVGELQAYCVLADQLGHPRGRYEALSRRAALALLGGRLDEAQQLAVQAAALGRRIGLPDVEGVLGTQLGTLAVLGGPDLANQLTSPEVVPDEGVRAVLVALAALGEDDAQQARRALEGYTLAHLRRQHDLEPYAYAAVAASLAGGERLIAELVEALDPLSGLHVVVGGCATYLGAVDHHLGTLAAARGDTARAERKLSAALEQHRRLGAGAWLGLTQAALEGVRGSATSPPAIFRRDGEVWTLAYGGRTVQLPDAKGLRDLAVLLALPGQAVPAARLYGGGDAPAPVGSDAVLDARARAAYKARLAELDEELGEAEAFHDPERVAKAKAERDALVEELTRAVGLSGRDRRLGDAGERARTAVTARIRDTLRRIERRHDDLGAHLRASVTTGRSCSYEPVEPVPWLL